jgi:heme/copper-type cytochrome/quinol oxidase subunit 2
MSARATLRHVVYGLGLAGIGATAALTAAVLLGPSTPRAAAAVPAPEEITVYVLPGASGFTGPDQKHHDTIAPSEFVLHRGVPVTFKIVNYDDGMHTIFAPDLDLNITIEPATPGKAQKASVEDDNAENVSANTPTTTTFTFTPEERGEFRWWCVAMCDAPSHWAMSDDYDGPARDGFMAGKIKVL